MVMPVPCSLQLLNGRHVRRITDTNSL